MAVIKGVDLLLKVGGQAIGGQKDATIDMSSEAIDCTHKQSGGWKEKVAGLKEWSASGEMVYFFDDAGLKQVLNAFKGGTTVEVELSKESEGIYFAGDVFVSSISVSAPMVDIVSASISFEGTGPLDMERP